MPLPDVFQMNAFTCQYNEIVNNTSEDNFDKKENDTSEDIFDKKEFVMEMNKRK